ncbi:MAG TPA: hypothetical protein PLP34_07455 [Chitinophagaceae bacterium]|nr:hypothetical protein [Chitinophagaceae bacterium]
MILLVITSVHEFGKDIRKILRQSGVTSYSYYPVTGHKDDDTQSNSDNWFAGVPLESDSVMFQVFTNPENGDKVMQLARTFNEQQETINHIHIIKLAVTDVV